MLNKLLFTITLITTLSLIGSAPSGSLIDTYLDEAKSALKKAIEGYTANPSNVHRSIEKNVLTSEVRILKALKQLEK